MTVDLGARRKVLVVHGVQAGSDADQNQHKRIENLLRTTHPVLDGTYETDIFRYEDIADHSVAGKIANLFKRILSVTKGGKLIGDALDIIADVVVARADASTAGKIRAGLKSKILESYQQQEPLLLVAHSLGSIYAFDVINELMATPDFFDRDNMTTWPVQGLITMGSPLGLALFGRSRVTRMGPGDEFFSWRNFWDPTDPVVSGSFYGKSLQSYVIEDRFRSHDTPSGWDIRDRKTDTGRDWLFAHTAYWDHKVIGDTLANFIIS